MKEVGDWQGLCLNLNIESHVREQIKFSSQQDVTKKHDCLEAFIKSGRASWSKVVEAVQKFPISNGKLAAEIAKKHNVDLDTSKNEL